ncbi:uncharacterized protein LOC118188399 [Stegodyphus dumicola]|uniref:uncharacterized protein LOC118188399 n=1 Tax=Stegodyphus dumicola TaxID=202533 RepID=UPI0015B2B2B3|nr:uncharacterized protein LOC118188399 [Stegodyphus dumicola]
MLNNFQTTHNRDYGWQFLSSEGLKKDSHVSRCFDYLAEPRKFPRFAESTYTDDYGQKTNIPQIPVKKTEIPFASPFGCDRGRHLVTTTQQNYDGRRMDSYQGNNFQKSHCRCHAWDEDATSLMDTTTEEPLDILTSIGPVPGIQRCRETLQWKTTYMRDYVYDPTPKPSFPFP